MSTFICRGLLRLCILSTFVCAFLGRQVSKVSQKARMEAELTSLDSQLERAKLAHAARCSRLEACKKSETDASPLSKRVLFPNETGLGGSHPTLEPDPQGGRTDMWTPQLDLSHETKVNTSIASLAVSAAGVFSRLPVSRLCCGRHCCYLIVLRHPSSVRCSACGFAGKWRTTHHMRSLLGRMRQREHVRRSSQRKAAQVRDLPTGRVEAHERFDSAIF